MTKQRLRRKILAPLILFMTIFSLIQLGVPAQSSITLVDSLTLSASGSGVSAWSTDSAHSGSWSVRLAASGQAVWNSTSGMGEDVNEGRITIKLVNGTTLGDIESISWWVNTTTGYPPHVDLLLDMDGNGVFDGGKKDNVTAKALSGNDDILVAEFAYQPYTGPGYEYSSPGIPYGHYDPLLQGVCYNPCYNTWVETFQNSTTETQTMEVNNETAFWLYSGLPGPYTGGFFGTLEDFKNGSVNSIDDGLPANVNASIVVLEIQIEVDNWLGAADPYIDDIKLNGEPILTELTPPLVEIIYPETIGYPPGDVLVNISAWDLFGVDKVWFNIKGGGDWIYAENQSYTVPTVMAGLAPGVYQFYAWANNTFGVIGSDQARFFVLHTEFTVEFHPMTLNLKSGGRWITALIRPANGYTPEDILIGTVELHINGETIDVEWGKAGDVGVMVKFNRSAVQELLEPVESVELKVSGKLSDDTTFVCSGNIRVIKPPANKNGPLNSKKADKIDGIETGNECGKKGEGNKKGNHGNNEKPHGNKGNPHGNNGKSHGNKVG